MLYVIRDRSIHFMLLKGECWVGCALIENFEMRTEVLMLARLEQVSLTAPSKHWYDT